MPGGTYIARFLWKEDKPYFTFNLAICTTRTKSLVKNLRCHPELLKLYNSILSKSRSVVDSLSGLIMMMLQFSLDNIISGCSTEDQLNKYYYQSRSILRQAGFNLRSWASNSTTLQQVATNDNAIDHNTTLNIFGMRCNTLTDAMSLAPKPLPSSAIVSKCSILQDSSQIYDPLGWATPNYSS